MADTEKNLVAGIEALLFIYGEPMDLKRMAAVLGVDSATVEATLGELATSLQGDGRGLTLVAHGGRYQLTTKPQFSKLFETIVKEEFSEGLSPASLEALTIITYAGPITRADLDYVRGVNSSFIVRALMIRGLIERVTDEKRGNAYLYGPTFDLLKMLGVGKVSELPDYEHFSVILKKTTTPEEQSAETAESGPSPNNENE